MASILKLSKSLYKGFGLSSVQDTGKDALFILLTRCCRMFAYGTNSLIMALFFAELGFSDFQIGLFMSLTLIGDLLLSLILTLIADRVGRRRILLAGSFMMVFSGLTFALSENFWILLIAAVVGVISPSGGEIGPFRTIEESTLSHLTNPSTRSDVLAWYVTTATLGSSIGTEVSGRIIQYLQEQKGWTLLDSYHAAFWVYTGMGALNMILVTFLSKDCEIYRDPELEYELIPEDDESDSDRLVELPSKKNSLFAQISPSTRRIMYKLGAFFALDALAGGMSAYSLTNYYIDLKFNISKATLGDVQSACYFLGAIGALFAGPLARRLGLINTMVFTHLPSSIALGLMPLPQNLPMTVLLLLVRAGLNTMDQAPRAAFIAAVVKAEERTAVLGILTMLRTLSQSAGPTITGILAANNKFWVAFVAAGVLRSTFDLGLFAMFANTKLHQYEGGNGAEGKFKGSSRA